MTIHNPCPVCNLTGAYIGVLRNRQIAFKCGNKQCINHGRIYSPVPQKDKSMLCPTCSGFTQPKADKNLCHNIDCEQYGKDVTGAVQAAPLDEAMVDLLRDCHDGKSDVHKFVPPNFYQDTTLPQIPEHNKDIEIIAQGGIQFETGAVRSADKAGVMYHLITPIGLRRIAETYKEGFDKYGAFNWERGMPIGDILNHAIAHIYAYLSGDDTGEDDLAHAAWNLLAAMHMEETHPGLNHQLRFQTKRKTNNDA